MARWKIDLPDSQIRKANSIYIILKAVTLHWWVTIGAFWVYVTLLLNLMNWVWFKNCELYGLPWTLELLHINVNNQFWLDNSLTIYKCISSQSFVLYIILISEPSGKRLLRQSVRVNNCRTGLSWPYSVSGLRMLEQLFHNSEKKGQRLASL